ncbi:MAG: SPASM domain-containing protein [Desulfarculaceae bacterium]|nr:SPASM domain-containing protein [Desulfarculaceae bacterium]
MISRFGNTRNVMMVNHYGIGNGILMFPILKAYEQSNPNVSYYHLENPFLSEIISAQHGGLCRFLGEFPSTWRRFRDEEIKDIRSFVSQSNIDTIVNLRCLSPDSDTGYENFRHQGLAKVSWVSLYEQSAPWIASGAHVFQCISKTLGVEYINYLPFHEQAYLRSVFPKRGTAPTLRIGFFLPASQVIKRWKVKEWVELALLLLERTNSHIMVFSGVKEDEKRDAEAFFQCMAKRGGKVMAAISHHPAKSLLSTINSLAALDILISNDTWAVHAADALDLPTVGLYFSTCPTLWGSRNPKSLNLWSPQGANCRHQDRVAGTCTKYYDHCAAPCRDGLSAYAVWRQMRPLIAVDKLKSTRSSRLEKFGSIMLGWNARGKDGRVCIENVFADKQTSIKRRDWDALAGKCMWTEEHSLNDAIEKLKECRILFDTEAEGKQWRDHVLNSQQPTLPLIDQVELTNQCCFQCIMCARPKMQRPVGWMAPKVFIRLLEQMSPKQKYIGLHHFGDSLLYNQLPHYISLAAQVGVETGLSGNPQLLTDSQGENILKAGLSHIVLSLDSLNPFRFKRIRGATADLALADANIRNFVRKRDEGGFSTCITLQMIQMNINHDEGEAFLEYATSVGVDHAVVVPVGRWDFEDDTAANLGVDETRHTHDFCRRPFESVVVLWDGRVVPCCHDYNGEIILGDLSHQTLQQIWDSTAVKAFRQGHERTSLCRRCNFSHARLRETRQRIGVMRFHWVREENLEWHNPESNRILKYEGFNPARK